jgi:uridine kinase
VPIVSTIAEKLESGHEPILVGIAGGSGSGKTTLARAVYDSLGADNVTYICHDQVCTNHISEFAVGNIDVAASPTVNSFSVSVVGMQQ